MNIHDQADAIIREIRESGSPDFHPIVLGIGPASSRATFFVSGIRSTIQAIMRSPACPSKLVKVEGSRISGSPDMMIQVMDLEGVIEAAVAIEAKVSHIAGEV